MFTVFFFRMKIRNIYGYNIIRSNYYKPIHHTHTRKSSEKKTESQILRYSCAEHVVCMCVCVCNSMQSFYYYRINVVDSHRENFYSRTRYETFNINNNNTPKLQKKTKSYILSFYISTHTHTHTHILSGLIVVIMHILVPIFFSIFLLLLLFISCFWFF